MSAYVAFLKAAFGDTPDALAIFGLPPRKLVKTPTAKARAAAVVKGEATRAARGTRGKVAKEDVTGGVVDVVLTPVKAAEPQPIAAPATGTAAATPPSPPAPAPAASPTKA
jgi:hypothetical protein